MTWSDFLPSTRSKALATEPVTVACSGSSGRFRQVLRITIRPERLDGGLAWWTSGTRVRVQLGDGEHAGLIRLSPAAGKDGVMLKGSGGRNALTALVLPDFRPLPGKASAAEAVEFDYQVDWVELTLPGWARATATPPAPALASAPPAPEPAQPKGKGTPFIGLGSQGHAETFALRRGSGPVKAVVGMKA